MKKKLNRYDKMIIGWLVGTLLPIIIFLIFYKVKYPDLSVIVYVKSIWQMKIFLKLFSLCVFPNLGTFMIFLNQKSDRAARGVILATFMYAFFVLIAKLI